MNVSAWLPSSTDRGAAVPDPFMARAIAVLRRIPPGRVTTFGGVAAAAGDRRGARQVVRLLHSQSERLRLPWQRVVNRLGRIGLPTSRGYFVQRRLLEAEGVEFEADGSVDLAVYGWNP